MDVSTKRRRFKIPTAEERDTAPKALAGFAKLFGGSSNSAPTVPRDGSGSASPPQQSATPGAPTAPVPSPIETSPTSKAACTSISNSTETASTQPRKFRKLEHAPSAQAADIDIAQSASPVSDVAPTTGPALAPATAVTTAPVALHVDVRSQASLSVSAPRVAETTPKLVAQTLTPARTRLDGTVFAFTGEMEAISRRDAEELAKALGAKVAGAVSQNVTYLVLGSRLEDGRKVEETSKYRKYLELKQKVAEKGKGKCPELLDEAAAIKLLGATPASAIQAAASASWQAANIAAKQARSGLEDPKLSVKALASWVDSHAPKGFGELVGNASVVKRIAEWLRDWDDVVMKGRTKKVPFKPGGGIPENVNARAILVSGPPGIGKTTTCRLAAQSHGGYEVLEYNASDARGQKVIQEMAEGIADNTTINFGSLGQKRNPSLTKRAVIMMDEVDGMCGGDRGGNAALIKMIKKTKNPIMCICNDEHSSKIRSLSFSCYHLKFTRPTKSLVAQRCAQIAQSEGLNVEPNALEALAESCGGDMRMVLNQLQMLAKSPMYVNGDGVTYTDMKARLDGLAKDQSIMLSPFDACKRLVTKSERARLSLRDKIELFFVDMSLVGLLVQENLYRTVEKAPCDVALMQRCAYAADLFTVGDIINNRINKTQEWGLLPHVAVVGCAYPSEVVNGFIAFPSFPSFLGKYSTMSRTRRLATELKAHVQLSTTVKRSNMVTCGYTDLLYRRLANPLINGGIDAVSSSAAVLDAYGLRREHFAEHLTELRQHLGGEDLFKMVDSKVKAAMTRELNTHQVRVALPTKKRKVAEPQGDPDGLMDEDAAGRVEEEVDVPADDDDNGLGGLLKMKGKSKAKAKARGGPRDSVATADGDMDAPSSERASPVGSAKGKAKARGKARTK